MMFPKCMLCGNRYNQDGIDGEVALKASLEEVRSKIERFVQYDNGDDDPTATTGTMSYSLKSRLSQMAQDRQDAMEAMRMAVLEKEATDRWLGTKTDKADELSQKLIGISDAYMDKAKTSSIKIQHARNYVGNVFSEVLFNHRDSSTISTVQMSQGLQQPLGTGFTTTVASTITSINSSSYTLQDHNLAYSEAGYDEDGISVLTGDARYRDDLDDDVDSTPTHHTVTLRATELAFQSNGGIDGEVERYRDPSTRGIMTAKDFNLFTSSNSPDYDVSSLLSLNLYQEYDSTADNDPIDGSHSDNSSSSLKDKVKLDICRKFMEGKCSLSTCPLAHPGKRDSCIPRVRIVTDNVGTKFQIPFVFVCPRGNGVLNDCPLGLNCKDFHVYVRPTTEEIIQLLYPTSTGRKIKEYGKSDAKFFGNVLKGIMSGYGVITWRNGSTYMGDWEDNKKHGWGIFRSMDGTEYVGSFREGVRSGWGIMSNANGDEYIGEWKNGKMNGVGLMQSCNGDMYEGHFVDNLFDGLGTFRKHNGDVYMGRCKLGMAHGLGILALSSGEKYKGSFDLNFRHGRGACAYRNGSRYYGNWYRGVHQGRGIYVSPDREKYVGDWAGGKKHGTGRYIFKNGDFYDGEFMKNKAHGVGTYYHVNGNIYTGEWANDMRNGKGTYVFANGSKYTGHWQDNDIHTKGKFDFANGAFYRGEFDHNRKHGRGIYTWKNGNVYSGHFVYDKLCGKGEMKYMMGHRYVGQWRDNKKNGVGILHYSSGPVYEGEFVDDQRHGRGKIVHHPNSSNLEESYDGEWSQDVIHGKGTYKYRREEGTIYEGDWVRGVRHGVGKLTFSDGSFYRGDFQGDQMYGKGIFVGTADNTQYDGEWKSNMRQGMGTAMDSDGSIYHGEYWGNMKHGTGRIQRPDGTTYSGTWQGGFIVGSGRVTIPVRDKEKRDGLAKEITLKVFGY